jgi:ATP-dependent RNA helicase DHX29
MAKKKKSQLKPVARGFATTSIAKKVVQSEAEEEVGGDVVADKTDEIQKVRNEGTIGGPFPGQDEADDFDPEKVETQSLQNLVDKLQERVEKEVSRTLKVGFIFCFLGSPYLCQVFRASKQIDDFPKRSLA